METEELGKDIIDGKIIDWSQLSTEELIALKEKLQKTQDEILKKIDEELTSEDF